MISPMSSCSIRLLLRSFFKSEPLMVESFMGVKRVGIHRPKILPLRRVDLRSTPNESLKISHEEKTPQPEEELRRPVCDRFYFTNETVTVSFDLPSSAATAFSSASIFARAAVSLAFSALRALISFESSCVALMFSIERAS